MSLPELISHYFIKIQWIVFISGLFFCFRILQNNSNRSQFKVREADRKDLNRSGSGLDLAQAKLASKKTPPAPPPLSLPGIRLTGEAHEILGVGENANETEVMKAYKDAIKRFHPDTIQGQAQDQLQFYQEAASKLNSAKETMLKRIRGR